MKRTLPENWVETTLGEIGEIVTGNTPPKKHPEFYGGDIPWVKPADINTGTIIKKTKETLTLEGGRNARILPQGAVMVTCIGNLGNVAITGKELATNQQINSLVISHQFTDKKFSYYWALMLKPWLIENSTATTISMVNKSNFAKAPFPLPPLAEQQRIVAKLDSLFSHLDSLQARLDKIPQLLADFRQSVLTQAVTGKLTEEWRGGKELEDAYPLINSNRIEHYKEKLVQSQEEKSKKPKKLDESPFEYFSYDENIKYPKSWSLQNLKNITDLVTDGEHATPKRTEDGYYLLSARNVQNGYISLKKVDYVGESEYIRIRRRCNPEFKDILISCSGTIGRISSVPESLDFVLVRSVALLKIQSNKELSPYLEIYLMSNIAQKQMNKLQKATAQANLFLGQIKKIVAPIPSFAEQTEIVRRVEGLFTKADAIQSRYESLRGRIVDLPQAILAKAFRGELVQQLPTDGDARDLLAEIQALRAAALPKKRQKK